MTITPSSPFSWRAPPIDLAGLAGARPDPYDASDREEAERFIGWHRNEAKPGAFVSFSGAQQYRKENRHDGILRYLVEQGGLTPALKKWRAAPPSSEPELSLDIDELAPDSAVRDAEGRPIVRGSRLTLRATVREIAPAKVDQIRWRAPTTARTVCLQRPMTATTQPTFLRPHVAARRSHADAGGHAVRGGSPRADDFLPAALLSAAAGGGPRPGLVGTALWRAGAEVNGGPAEVSQGKLAIEATCRPRMEGPAAPKMLVTLRNITTGKEVQAQAPAIRATLELQPGTNELEIVAWNEGLEPGLRDYGTTRQRLPLIKYIPERVPPPPQVTLESVKPAPLPPSRSMAGVSSRSRAARGCARADHGGGATDRGYPGWQAAGRL